MNRILPLAIVLASGLLVAPASAGVINASGTVQSTALAGGVFDYTITLTNNSSTTDPIGTFWFSWVPGQDFMGHSPISVASPAGWADRVTGGGATDGFAIQWVAGANAPAFVPGSSLSFSFTSLETPAQLAGNSPFHGSFPELTAVLFNGAPFSADSEQIQVTVAPGAVPEPSSLVLTLFGGLSMIAYKRMGRRQRT
jgi:hypothetical protein